MRRLRPSGIESGAVPVRPSAPAPLPESALPPLLRGDLIHRLLAGLPEVAEAEREAAGLRLLRHAADGVDDAAHRAILAEALAVLRHAPLAELFGAGSRAEVPVIGRIAGAGG